ncbi:FAD-binding oxidoreductase [Phenylobacterium sp.]|uniref:NAD(P)/FAD-dependent oxidoreductase n=1 Tax=Phenylobacterium sp. TaxID=1871053 RepID=UPI0025D0DA5B|nr:FAD-binding oxidoreductase [Phenylobacterium sp.]MBX3482788.1 FAD-binding oxidoreductase [Phenylobacterium sp.]MCW5760813.1 FAD-binding oxidoreductase [Phenylobacterium sp.]
MQSRFIVIGAGLAGASAAAFLAEHGPVAILEAEDQPGYHTTGRSAASYIDTYGHPIVCAATRASRDFFWNPPAGFAEHPLVRPRAELEIARPEQAEALAAMLETHGSALRPVGREEILRLSPILRPGIDWSGAINEATADIDVDAVLQGFLRLAKARGAQLVTGARVTGLDRVAGGWRVRTPVGEFRADAVVNAAGAWAGEVGRLAGLGDLGLTPLRRTALKIEPAMKDGLADWPFVIDVEETFYFRPDGGGLMLSPADETPSEPCDAQPDEMDVAIAVDAFEQATTETVRRVAHRWAGLRTFAPDRIPVVGPDPREPAFLWLAGQGGYGIQTAPALAMAAAALATTGDIHAALKAQGVTAADLGPSRLL